MRAVTPSVDADLEGIRQGHLAAVLPHLFVALVGVVVQGDEVTHVLQFATANIVVALDQRIRDAFGREQLILQHHRAHRQVDAGRFQRFDEATGQAQRHHVLVPGLEPATGAELHLPWVPDRLGANIVEQLGARLVVGHVTAVVHQSAANAVLHRDVPAPARFMGDGARVRHRRRVDRTGLHRNRAVAGQPVVPVLIAGFQRLLDQQAAEAGAIDEQVTFDHLAIVQHQRLDVATVGILAHFLDHALDPVDPVTLEFLAQEIDVERGIHVVRVVDFRVFGQREFVFQCRHRFQAEIAQIRFHATAQALQPVLLEPGDQCAFAGVAEGMDVAMAWPDEVFERDGQLERAGYRAQEFLLVDVHEPVEVANRWHGGFAHTDGGDLGRFHQRQLDLVLQLIRQRACRDPSRRAATGNNHLANSVVAHVYPSPFGRTAFSPAFAGIRITWDVLPRPL